MDMLRKRRTCVYIYIYTCFYLHIDVDDVYKIPVLRRADVTPGVTTWELGIGGFLFPSRGSFIPVFQGLSERQK